MDGNLIRIREKKLEDAVSDYAWCCDPELSRLDAARPLAMSLSGYISEYSAELRYPSLTRRRFAVETMDGKHIGNCSYYNIDLKRREAEVGIMIGDRDYWSKGYGTDTINTLISYVFDKTNFNKLYLKTLDWNFRAQQCFRKCGFTQYNRIHRDGHDFVLMEISRDGWQKMMAEQEQYGRNAVAAEQANSD